MDCMKYIFDYNVLLILLAIYLFYKLGKIRYDLHVKLGRKGPEPFPFLGNFPQLLKYGEFEFHKICREKYGKIYPLYYGNMKMIMISDEELLKHILVKDSKYFLDRKDYGFNGFNTSKMLHTVNGKNWERIRNFLNPVFSPSKLRKMSPLIMDAANLMEQCLECHPIDKPVDFMIVFNAFTMDVAARTMFGMSIDTQSHPNNVFMLNASKLTNFSLFHTFLALFFLFPEFAKGFRKVFPNWEALNDSAILFFFNNLKKVVEERKRSSQVFNDLLSSMLDAQKEVDDNDPDKMNDFGKKSLTIHEIMAQSILFLLAGYVTTSITLTFLVYFLAKNPHYQQELYTEIMEKIGIDGEITYDLLMDMPILDAAIKETLRICPPAAKFDKQCNQDVTLTSSDNTIIKIKKGDTILIPIYAIHTDPSIWSHPDIYDLHRFDPENKKNRSPFSYLPFGMGPRNCIGMKFALFEAKWAIVTILRRFELVPCAETLDVMKFKKARLATPIKPIILKIVKRN